jgi:hypothetical protein
MKLSLLCSSKQVAENINNVSQQNTDEIIEEPHVDSKICSVSSPNKDGPCKANEDPLGEPTEGTDEEDVKVSGTQQVKYV